MTRWSLSTHYMDEAERCHELVYIAYGKVLARGTERDAALVLWAVQGETLTPLVAPPKAAPDNFKKAA